MGHRGGGPCARHPWRGRDGPSVSCALLPPKRSGVWTHERVSGLQRDEGPSSGQSKRIAAGIREGIRDARPDPLALENHYSASGGGRPPAMPTLLIGERNSGPHQKYGELSSSAVPMPSMVCWSMGSSIALMPRRTRLPVRGVKRPPPNT